MSSDMNHRYIFVGGLHRSGTSLLAECLGRHHLIGSIRHAPVPEQEGVYLQGAIPHDAKAGIPGAWAEDPGAHLVEGCAYDRLETRERIEADWAPWFPPTTPWRVEKSPVNLLRSRLYQQLFPTCVFLFVVRHPVAVSAATAKWSSRSPEELLGHWQVAHQLLLGDLAHLHCWLVVRYEDLIADPDQALRRVFDFLDLAHVDPPPGIRPDGNAAYFQDWSDSVRPVPAAASFGYGLAPIAVTPMEKPAGHHYYRSITEIVS